MGLALDEPTENDKIFKEDGLTFVVENNLLNNSGGIKVDYIENGYRSGFSITSLQPVTGGGSSCASSCSSSSSSSCGC